MYIYSVPCLPEMRISSPSPACLLLLPFRFHTMNSRTNCLEVDEMIICTTAVSNTVLFCLLLTTISMTTAFCHCNCCTTSYSCFMRCTRVSSYFSYSTTISVSCNSTYCTVAAVSFSTESHSMAALYTSTFLPSFLPTYCTVAIVLSP